MSKVQIVMDSDLDSGSTKSPLESTEEKIQHSSETSDSLKALEDYQQDSKSIEGSINTGAFIPKDMTVKLVRADSANLDFLLSTLYSLCLTFFGLFLGAWLTDANNFTNLEKTATIILGLLSVVLVGVWISLKVRQQKSSVLIPYNTFKHLIKEDK